MEIPDITPENAREWLDARIRDYQATVSPTQQVEDWLLITEKLDMDDGRPVVGVAMPFSSTWVRRRGLLDIAMQRERNEDLKTHLNAEGSA